MMLGIMIVASGEPPIAGRLLGVIVIGFAVYGLYVVVAGIVGGVKYISEEWKREKFYRDHAINPDKDDRGT